MVRESTVRPADTPATITHRLERSPRDRSRAHRQVVMAAAAGTEKWYRRVKSVTTGMAATVRAERRAMPGGRRVRARA